MKLESAHIANKCWESILEARKFYKDNPNLIRKISFEITIPYSNHGLGGVLNKHKLSGFRAGYGNDESNTHILEEIKKLSISDKLELLKTLKSMYIKK